MTTRSSKKSNPSIRRWSRAYLPSSSSETWRSDRARACVSCRNIDVRGRPGGGVVRFYDKKASILPPCRNCARTRRIWIRSEEHTSELQSRENLVCRLLLEKKNKRR